MISLAQLPKITEKKKKRLGQGHGSGKGKTAGRGTKGQSSRGTLTATFSGSELSNLKRLPLIRGKYRNKKHKKRPIPVNVKYLNILPPHAVVDIGMLISHNLVTADDAKKSGVKILGDGDINIALTVKLPCSKNARKKIEKAGGKIEPVVHATSPQVKNG